MSWYPPELQLRSLIADDAERVVALSSEAGWNQTPADWRLMIGEGDTWGLWQQQQAVASTLILPYEKFGWISMVLVTARWRRRGLATRLLRNAIGALLERGLTPGLDATEAGRPLYETLGFQSVYSISRLALQQRTGTPQPVPPLPPGITLRRLRQNDSAALTAWDGAAFGADRRAILTTLRTRLPQAAHIAVHDSGAIAGFILSRDGRVASQIGPLVADSAAIAGALMATALRSLSGPVFIDAVEPHRDWLAYLYRCGFQRQRGFTRMLLRRSRPFGQVGRIFAIAGPELG